MKSFQLLIIISLGATLLNVIIQLVGLIFGIKYYIKPSSNKTLTPICAKTKACNARKTYREADLPDGLMNNPEYLVMESDLEPGLFFVEEFRAARLETEAHCHRAFTDNDLTFYIFAKENPKGANIKFGQVKHLLKLGFKTTRPTLLLIPGWKNTIDWPFPQVVKDAVLKSTHDLNLIAVDYSPISKTCYPTAVKYAEFTGNIIGDFILKLQSELNYGIQQVTVIGHSLGSQVAGYTGARLKGRLEIIIGLDPAGPIFKFRSPRHRLDPTDAKYVQVVHTSLLELGIFLQCGHVDIYPNGGKRQPGCFTEDLDLGGMCSHSRAYYYYAESLLTNNFVSWSCTRFLWFVLGKCKNNPTLRMGGFPIDTRERGKFYLYTKRKSPYAKGNSMTLIKDEL